VPGTTDKNIQINQFAEGMPKPIRTSEFYPENLSGLY